jgi:hypothetical protein
MIAGPVYILTLLTSSDTRFNQVTYAMVAVENVHPVSGNGCTLRSLDRIQYGGSFTMMVCRIRNNKKTP